MENKKNFGEHSQSHIKGEKDLRDWLNSQDGENQLQETISNVQSMMAEFDTACHVDPNTLRKKIV